MVLSDRDIRSYLEEGKIIIESPFENYLDQIQPASFDVRLGTTFKVYEHSRVPVLDPRDKEKTKNLVRTIDVEEGEPFVVQPGEFVIGATIEKIKVPDDIVVVVNGRSSLGRLGIIIHATAGYVDPGFEGTITLEISNINRLPVALYPGMRIAQYVFQKLSSPCEEPYGAGRGSKYSGQVLPEESGIFQDKEFDANYTLHVPSQRNLTK